MHQDKLSQDNALHRILVVDDEEIVLVALRETLRREGYQVDTTTDALQAIADQADVVGFSHQLEVESDLADPFTSSEMERIAQSFVRSLKVMLFDLAPANFWEHHLARYYASTLSATEARRLVRRYDSEILIPTSRVQELRWNFVTDRLPDLLPVVRARSHRFRRRAAASTRNRNTFRSTRRTSCSFAVARSTGSRRSSSRASAESRSASRRKR